MAEQGGHLLVQRLQFRRPLLALTLPGSGLGGEVHRLGEPAVAVQRDGAADDVGSQRAQGVAGLFHELTHPVDVAGPALDDLHEPGAVGTPVQKRQHPFAVVEGDVTVEAAAGLVPPQLLLGPFAVAPRRLRRFEADNGDRRAVGSRTPGRAEPARRPGGDLVAPPLDRVAKPVSVTDLAVKTWMNTPVLRSASRSPGGPASTLRGPGQARGRFRKAGRRTVYAAG